MTAEQKGWTQPLKQPGIVLREGRRKEIRHLNPRRANLGKWLKDTFRKANDARLLLSEHRLVLKRLEKLR